MQTTTAEDSIDLYSTDHDDDDDSVVSVYSGVDIEEEMEEEDDDNVGEKASGEEEAPATSAGWAEWLRKHSRGCVT